MKSSSLQGLRGIAVIAVVLFHMKVRHAKHGFLGVDIFFVLSGFFMARSISTVSINFTTSIEFYKRRLKRLLPSYSLIIALLVVSMSFFLILGEIDAAVAEIYPSLAFLINIKFSLDTDSYWRKDHFFLSIVMHLWSLAVEMQFYLIVPLIYFIINRSTNHRIRLATLACLAAGSLLSFCSESIDQRRFYLLHNRLWEFITGFIVAEVAAKMTSKDGDTLGMERRVFQTKLSWSVVSYCSTLLLLWSLSGGKLRPHDTVALQQVVACCLAALIILAASATGNRLLDMRWLVYVGDLSYVLYLIHWPVIVFEHTISLTSSFQTEDMLISAVVSMILSIIVHHLYEKPLLSRSFGFCLIISTVLYSISIAALLINLPHRLSDTFIDYRQSGNATLRSALEWNARASLQRYPSLPQDCMSDQEVEEWIGSTENEEERCQSHSNGTFRVLVLGNSVSRSSFPTVHRALDGRYHQLRLFSQPGCEVLQVKAGPCDNYWRKAQIVMKKMRPDVILLTEHHASFFNQPGNKNLIKSVQHQLDILRKSASVVMVDTPYLLPTRVYAAFALAHTLARGGTELAEAREPLDSMLHAKRLGISRVEELRGGNVVKNNITHGLCMRERGVCDGYDPRTLKAFNTDVVHLSEEAYKLLLPTYRSSIDKVLKIAEQRRKIHQSR